jgi:hypothetical protein
MRRWTCPSGEHPGCLAPEKMGDRDVRRFCMPCSSRHGQLVDKVCPALERARATRARAKKASEQARADKLVTVMAGYGFDVLAEARKTFRALSNEPRGLDYRPPFVRKTYGGRKATHRFTLEGRRLVLTRHTSQGVLVRRDGERRTDSRPTKKTLQLPADLLPVQTLERLYRWLGCLFAVGNGPPLVRARYVVSASLPEEWHAVMWGQGTRGEGLSPHHEIIALLLAVRSPASPAHKVVALDKLTLVTLVNLTTGLSRWVDRHRRVLKGES